MNILFRALALFALLVTLAACNKDDDVPEVELGIPPPAWKTGITFIDPTNIPDSLVNRFVRANNMDTVQTASGLVYQIDEPGGAEKPSSTSTVTVHYRGYLLNGRIFDQTDERGPRTFNLDGLIPAWKEGIPKLGRGGRMWMVVRPGLAYGNRASDRIPANSVIVFEIQLLDFE